MVLRAFFTFPTYKPCQGRLHRLLSILIYQKIVNNILDI